MELKYAAKKFLGEKTMNKKFASLLLAASMVVPCAFAFTACDDSMKIDGDKWVSAFGSNSFGCWAEAEVYADGEKETIKSWHFNSHGYEYDYISDEIESEGPDGIRYKRKGGSYYKEVVDGVTKYYSWDEDQNGITVEEITTEGYTFEYDRSYFAPLLDFVRDNMSTFQKPDAFPYYVYEGEATTLDAGVKETLDKMLGEYANSYYSLEVTGNSDTRKVESLCVYTNTYAQRQELMHQFGSSNEAYDPFRIVSFRGFGSNDLCIPLYQKSLDSMTNFKVIGGEGIYRTELYFDGDTLRLYTPEPEPGADPKEAIFKNDNGTYKYYVRTGNGAWSVTTLEKEDYESRVEELYNMFGGGAFYEESRYFLIDGNQLKAAWDYGNRLEWREFKGGHSGLFDVMYTNVVLDINDNDQITGGSWRIKYKQTNMGDQEIDTGAFTLTLGGVSIEIPNV